MLPLRADYSEVTDIGFSLPSQQRAGSRTAGPTCQWSRMASEGASIPSPVVRQIDKQFLICSICLERYKNPKVLPCLHTFCER